MQPGIDAFQADHEQISALARLTYLNTLPPKRAKPGIKSNGRIEWTILAAFVLSFPTSPQSCQYALISLATGLKCLPYTALPPNGDVLHDQHAEVLARRGARQWLLSRLQHEVGSHNEQALRLFESASSEEAVGRRTWRLKDGVRLHLYVSTLPCGDASNTLLEFQRAAQDQVAGREGALTPTDLLQLHANGPNTSGITATIGTGGSGAGSVVRGRASSSHQQSTQAASGGTGSLRTKPGRPDAPPSTSMSCSDKLALWNAPGIGIQGSLLSSLLEPVYIHSITMSDHPTRHIFPAFPLHPTEQATCEKQRRALKRILLDHCRRALQRARKPDTQEIALGWSAEPFADSKEIKLEQAWSAMTSNASFSEHSPTQELETFKARYEPVSCSNSVLYIRDPRFESNGMKGKIENLGNGTRMGAPTKRPKPTDPMGAESEPLKPPARSAVCRLNYFQTFVSAFHSITASGTPLELQDASYGDVKEGFFGQGTKAYRMRKLQLLGSKEDALQMVENFLHGARVGTAIKAVQQADATVMKQEDRQRIPEGNQDVNMLKGWLRSPISLSRFNLQGRTTCAVQADI